jgi:hypothetical protein
MAGWAKNHNSPSSLLRRKSTDDFGLVPSVVLAALRVGIDASSDGSAAGKPCGVTDDAAATADTGDGRVCIKSCAVDDGHGAPVRFGSWSSDVGGCWGGALIETAVRRSATGVVARSLLLLSGEGGEGIGALRLRGGGGIGCSAARTRRLGIALAPILEHLEALLLLDAANELQAARVAERARAVGAATPARRVAGAAFAAETGDFRRARQLAHALTRQLAAISARGAVRGGATGSCCQVLVVARFAAAAAGAARRQVVEFGLVVFDGTVVEHFGVAFSARAAVVLGEPSASTTARRSSTRATSCATAAK